MSKILYAASSAAHLRAFHVPYIEALRAEGHTVVTLGGGDGADLDVRLEKKYLSRANAKSRREIRKIITEGKFDTVIVNTSLAAFHVRRSLPKHGVPRLVNVVHGYLFPEFADTLKARLRRTALLTAEKLLRKRTDAIVVMNAEDLRIATVERLSSADPYFISGMGVPKRHTSNASSSLKARLGLEGKYLLTFVGELSARKNQAFLVDCMPKILKEIPAAHLLLVGDGAEHDALSALITRHGIGDNVTLLGKRDDVADILAITDVYVSASKSEGLPFNIAEALAEGKQIVASAVKGHTDMLDGGAGTLFPLGDSDGFVKAVTAVHGGVASSDDSIRAAYERYSLERVFPETLAVIKEAARL